MRDDGAVMVVARTREAVSYVVSSFTEDGVLQSRADPAHPVADLTGHGWIVELGAGGVLTSRPITHGETFDY